MTAPQHGFFVATEPNFDDDDLEEIQQLLWRGYVPKPHIRMDFALFPHCPAVPHKSPQPQPEPKPKPKKRPKTVLQYSTFKCDGCERTFRSVIDEAEADAAYHKTFGAAATDERLALCEDCYNKAMEGYDAGANGEK